MAKSKTLSTARLVLVDWVDAHTKDGWHAIQEFIGEDVVTVRTVGWAIRDDNIGLWLAHGFSHDTDSDETSGLNLTFIPRGMVLKVQELSYD